MMRKPSSLLRDERGASIIEMGLMLPVLATLLIGMVDISRGYSAKLQLEQAAQRSIEKAMNGDKETGLFETLEDEAVTVRDRDTWEQERVKVADLPEHLKKRLDVGC